MKTLKNILGTNLAFFIILTAVVFIIYGKTINYELTKYDDDSLITRNISFIANPTNIPELFKTSCFYKKNYAYYRPILTLSFAIETILFGNNSKIFHLSNIILFILSIYLMYVFISCLNQKSVILKYICILIAVHPIFSSTVVWIPARNDTLLLIFTFLSFINLAQYIKSYTNLNLFFFIVTFFIALLTKETSLILLPTYVVFIYTFNLQINKNQIIKLILWILPAIFFYLYLRNISISGSGIKDFELSKYTLTALKGTMIYISNFLIPNHISLMMYKFNICAKTLLLNILLLLLLLISINKKIIHIKVLLFGFFWFIIWIAPTFILNDYVLLFHRLLIPITGLVIIFNEIIKNLITKYTLIKKYFLIFFTVLFCVYSFASYIQSEKYKNAPVFWSYAYSDAPDYHIACHGLGLRFMEINNYEKALDLMFAAENYSPNRYLLDIAAVFLYQQRFDEAEKILLKSVELSPGTSDLAYGNLAKLYAYKKDFKKAMEYVNKTYELNKYDIEFTKLLITIYTMNGEFKKALDMCFSLLQYDKKNAQYYYKIGELYELMKDYKNALKYVEEGLKLAPENIQLIEKAKSLKKIENDSV
ncbi:MAG: tetratricopeptide repeat protein [Endomicrobiaceae bacterium]|jgi:Flp pilus assembly protein TadD|nr:tetratricopeptide repeat protein [Endomicrobiaceae bacterium]